MNTIIIERLQALRRAMQDEGIDLTIIPHADPHQSEYMSDHWHIREFFSGFNGSAGTLVVSTDKAFLWTDSRYFLQAADQLAGTTVELMKDGLPDTPSINQYITNTLKKGDTVGIDGIQFSINATRALRNTLNEHGIKLVTNFTPVDKIWTDRTPIPADKAFVHDVKYTGESAAERMKKALHEAKKLGAGAIFISALDEIAWTLSIRGRDVKYNPVVTSFLYLAPQGSTLFIDSVKIDDKMSAYLATLGVAVAPYNAVKDFLASLPADEKVLVDPASTSDAFTSSLGERALEAVTPIKLLKAVRNEVQIEGTRAAHVRDGVALVRSIMELERRLAEGDKITEIEVCHILTRQRSLMEEYFDDSFGTIDGYKEHGAIVHYEPTTESDATIQPDGILLIDSGAQYFDGTTDITRTISLGNPTDEERRDFTLVLKGHIALATVVFPTGTRGVQLDVLARQFLWSEGKTYLHGTGHGVGHFLNVHEGPQSIRMNEVPTTIVAGMLTSNEPGLYVTGKYGIRCENLVLSVPAYETEYGSFLKFETVTLFPFDLNLLDLSIMTDAEIKWLNEYHATVFEKLAPRLTDEERAWLADKTHPINK